MDPTQSPEGQPVAPTNGADGAQPQTPNPVQQRIDELTGQFRETQRQLVEQQNLNQRMMADMLARQNAPVAPTAPSVPTLQIPEGMDPTMAAFLKAQNDAWAGQFAAMQKQTQELVANTARQSAMSTAQLAFQQAVVGEDPRVAQRAATLLNAWQSDPRFQGWTPKDAIIYARGELGVPAPGAMQPGGRPLQQVFQQGGQTFNPFTPGGAPPPNTTQEQGPGERLPDVVLDRMHPKARAEYEESRMAKWGKEGQPIVY